jgi:hypothetical protein
MNQSRIKHCTRRLFAARLSMQDEADHSLDEAESAWGKGKRNLDWEKNSLADEKSS